MECEREWRLTERLHASSGKDDPFAAAVRATRMAMIITDPRQNDNPIVFANDAFLRLTGYTRHEVIGRNCRFLQGPDTNRAAIARVRKAIERCEDITIELLNYRKDGTTFWNALYLSPVTDEAGDLLFFFGSQLDVTAYKEAERIAKTKREEVEQLIEKRTHELQAALAARSELLHKLDHRVKNNLQLITALVVLEQKEAGPPVDASLRSLRERIEALAIVHRHLYEGGDPLPFRHLGFPSRSHD